MGILGLSKLIADIAPVAVKESEIKHYFGMYDVVALVAFSENVASIMILFVFIT
jgi:hypothetical protein